MKASILSVSFGALIMSATLVGCGGDDLITGNDLSALLDMGAQSDLPSTAGCTSIATWPSDSTYAGLIPNPFDGYDAESTIYGDKPGTGMLIDSLGVEIYNQTGATPSYPQTVTLSSTGGYNDCDQCVVAFIGQDYNAQTYGTMYFATGGTITVTKADRSQNGGTVAISGSKVHLVEWLYDQNNDKAVSKGKCIDVNAFSFTADYDALAGDGGADM